MIDTSLIPVHIRMEDLKPHPENAVIYGQDQFDIKMMESIRKHGIKEPLVVTKDRVIISGHRRWCAALKLLPEGSELPCRIVEFADELEEREALIVHNQHREKTLSQRMKEASELDRIEGERAKRRRGARTDIPAILPEGSKAEFGETREKVAEKIGMKPRTYGKAKKVFEAAEAGDAKAQEMVKKLDDGEVSIDKAHREVTGKGQHKIRIRYTATINGAQKTETFVGEMPDVGERALAWIRAWRDGGYHHVVREVTLDGESIAIVGLVTKVREAGGNSGNVPISPQEPEPAEASWDGVCKDVNNALTVEYLEPLPSWMFEAVRTGRDDMRVSVMYTVNGNHPWPDFIEFTGTMPEVGINALRWVNLWEASDVHRAIKYIRFAKSESHTPFKITPEALVLLVKGAGGEVPQKPERSPWVYRVYIDYLVADEPERRTVVFGGKTPEEAVQIADALTRHWDETDAIASVEINGRPISLVDFRAAAIGQFDLNAIMCPAPAEKAPKDAATLAPVQDHVTIPPEILALKPDEVVTIGVWYQWENMVKPEYSNNRQELAVGVIGMTDWMRYREKSNPEVVFPKVKIGKFETTREVLEALRPWGRMHEEEEHTISVYYTAPNDVPHVKFFDGVPAGAARETLRWLRSREANEIVLRRIHYADGAGSHMDVSREGLSRLAMPAPEKRDPPAKELDRLYLERVRGEIESMLQFDKYPYESVLVAIDRVEVRVPPAERLPEILRENLQQDGEVKP